ncbi:hypothetical protein OG271_14895 [Micromonospora rifamycinica]|uniref:hypothetical protein n=1 Tax=Micromonospora rifamycinica TaxID=291594 RepID=UPI002E2E7692|nr:hypothetical protein [Micromonospora rifamycinica]
MTQRPHGTSAAGLSSSLFNRRHDPGRYPALDRNDNPDPHVFIHLNDVPVNRPRDSYCMEGTS